MTTRTIRRLPVLPLLALAALVAIVLWALTNDDPMSPLAPATPTTKDAAAPGVAMAATSSTPPTSPDPAPSAERTAADPAAPPPPVAALPGQVLDSRGLPLAGVPVAWAQFDSAARRLHAMDAASATTSDERGRFSLPTPTPRSVPTAGHGWFTLRTTTHDPRDAGAGASGELLLIAAPAVALTGRVTGVDGAGLPAATVRAQLFLLTEFPRLLDQTVVPQEDHTTTDANGDYRLATAPVAAGVDFVFARQGYITRRIASREAASGRLEVTLTTLTGANERLHGRVRDADGPVAGAALLLGFDQETRSDALGEFTFEFPRRPSRLLATRRGWQPVSRDGVGRNTPEVEIVFTARALAIAGEVRLADGPPAVGWRLDLLDPVRGRNFHGVETACSDVDPALATTDAQGRFRIGGLAERSYRLLAYHTDPFGAVESEAIAAGTTDAVLTVPADALVEALRGTVVDRRGAPLPGVAVHAYLTPTATGQVVPGPTAMTAADGRFVLKQVPRRVGKLGVSKEGYRYVMQSLADCTRDGAELHVVLQRMCALQVEGEAGFAVTFFDDGGAVLHAESHSQGMVFSSNATTLHGGKSAVMTLPETTATMAWSRDGKELGRKPVFLDPAPGAITLLIAAP